MTDLFDLDNMPLLQLFLLSFLLFLLSLWAGIIYGKRYSKGKKEPEKGFSVIVAGQMTLVAFVIAFVFGMVSTRFDVRRSNLLQETNSIGTTYLRTDFVPEPIQSELKKLLKEYVNVKVYVYYHPESLEEGLKRSDEILDELWKKSSSFALSQPSSEIVALYIQTLNETIDLHSKRVTVAITQKVPPAIWITSYVLAVISMFIIGFESGILNARMSIPGILFALTFTLVITLISDLDRSREGMFKVNQKPLVDLQSKINSEVK